MAVHDGKPRVGQGKLGIKRNRLRVELLRCDSYLPSKRFTLVSRASALGKARRHRDCRSASPQGVPFLPARVSPSARRDLRGQFALQANGISDRSVIALGPDMAVVSARRSTGRSQARGCLRAEHCLPEILDA